MNDLRSANRPAEPTLTKEEREVLRQWAVDAAKILRANLQERENIAGEIAAAVPSGGQVRREVAEYFFSTVMAIHEDLSEQFATTIASDPRLTSEDNPVLVRRMLVEAMRGLRNALADSIEQRFDSMTTSE